MKVHLMHPELDFDVATNVEGACGAIDVVWLDRRLPLAAAPVERLDLRDAPVLPVVAFAVRTSAMLDTSDPASLLAALEGVGARLRILVIARDGRQAALAPALQSLDQLHRLDEDAAVRARLMPHLRGRAGAGRTVAMLQSELVEWARRLFPQVDTSRVIPWAGLRPMMPNLMPRVGAGRRANVFYNTGHGHLGWTLSAATAEMVAEQIRDASERAQPRFAGGGVAAASASA